MFASLAGSNNHRKMRQCNSTTEHGEKLGRIGISHRNIEHNTWSSQSEREGKKEEEEKVSDRVTHDHHTLVRT